MQETLAQLAPFWLELRKRLLFCLSFFAGAALFLMFFCHLIFNFFAAPIQHTLPPNQSLIATGVVSGFWIPIELSIWLALLITLPILLWQLWRFAKPALKVKEKFWAQFYLFTSSLLIVIGIFFGYFAALPVCLHFLLLSAPLTVHVMPDIVNYVNFSVRLLLALAVASQLPLVMLLLVQLQWLTIEQFKAIRRYVIIAAFVIGMIIAPDVVSQCFIAIPLWLLYELGLVMAGLFQSRNRKGAIT